MLEGRGTGALGEEGEGIKKYKLAVDMSDRDVKHSLGSIVHNDAISMYGARWVVDLPG